mgnify:CR=1 FL=1
MKMQMRVSLFNWKYGAKVDSSNGSSKSRHHYLAEKRSTEKAPYKYVTLTPTDGVEKRERKNETALQIFEFF